MDALAHMMSSPNIDAIPPNPWFQDDYRSSSPFRGKHVAELKDEWSSEKNEKSIPDKSDNSKFGKYSLVIVIPSTVDNNTENAETSNGQSGNVQADSGVGSMSPSPPKTPTPDYDSLEDFFDDDYHGIADGYCPVSLPPPGSTKKVHFSVTSDTSEDSDDITPMSACKSSWRDALIANHIELQDHLSYCYRQDWVNGETKSKTKALNKHHISSTTVAEDLDHRSRTESRRKRNTKLVRRSSSLDRLADLRYSYRTPLLCDPDPLKVPVGSSKRNMGRRAQRQAAMER